MDVESLMTRDPITIDAGATLDEALSSMDHHDVRHLPVLEDGSLVGVLSDRNLLEATGWLPARMHDARDTHPNPHRNKRVRDVMHSPVHSVEPDDSIVTSAVEMACHAIGCLPVLRDGKLVGMLTEIDLLKGYGEAVRQGHLPEGQDPPLGDFMTKSPKVATAERTVDEALELCRSIGARHLPVVQNHLLVGIISDRDLRGALGRGRRGDYPIEELMSRDLIELGRDARMSEAARLMVEHKISCLPVLEDDELIGILTMTDLVDHCMNTLRDEDKFVRKLPGPKGE